MDIVLGRQRFAYKPQHVQNVIHKTCSCSGVWCLETQRWSNAEEEKMEVEISPTGGFEPLIDEFFLSDYYFVEEFVLTVLCKDF